MSIWGDIGNAFGSAFHKVEDGFKDVGGALNGLGQTVGAEIAKGFATVGKYTLVGGKALAGLSEQGGALALKGLNTATTVTVRPVAETVDNLVIRQRKLTADERAFAASVFGNAIPLDEVVVTNLVEVAGRPFTLPVAAGQTLLNLGGAYDDPLKSLASGSAVPGALLAQELTRAWQVKRGLFQPGFVTDAALQGLQNLYDPVKGPDWGKLTNEQQAAIVRGWFARGRSPQDPWYRYILALNGGAAPTRWGPVWSGWESLGGVIQGGVGAVAVAGQIVDLYVRGTDDALWQRSWDRNRWLDWHRVDGSLKLASAPLAVSLHPAHRDVYAQGPDGRLYHKFWINGAWSAWENLGGPIKGFGLVSVGDSIVDVYARGMDDALWQKTWDRDHWIDWRRIDGSFPLDSAPSVVSSNPNHRDVYVRGKDGALWHKFWVHGSWSGWESLGGGINGTPGAIAVGDGIVESYVRGGGDLIWQRSWDHDHWLGWNLLDVSFALDSSPVVVSLNPDHRDVYVRGKDGGVYHKWRA